MTKSANDELLWTMRTVERKYGSCFDIVYRHQNQENRFLRF